jgi:hypothetical protein
LAPQRQDVELLKVSLEKLAFDNVYFDLASLAHNQQPEKFPYPTAVRHLQTAKEVVGYDKLMFGTDIPGNLCRDTYAHLRDYIIDGGVFTKKELQAVFYDTANKVYFGGK